MALGRLPFTYHNIIPYLRTIGGGAKGLRNGHTLLGQRRYFPDTINRICRANWVFTIFDWKRSAKLKRILPASTAFTASVTTTTGLVENASSSVLCLKCLPLAGQIFLFAFPGQTKTGRGVGMVVSKRFS